jgi:hypothetical protein
MGVEISAPPVPVSGTGGTAGSVPTAPVPSNPVSAIAAVNTATVVTINGVAGQSVRLTSLSVSYNAAPTGGLVTVVVNAVTILQLDIPTQGPFAIPLPPGGLECAAGQNCVITLAAAGAAVQGRVNVSSYTGA